MIYAGWSNSAIGAVIDIAKDKVWDVIFSQFFIFHKQQSKGTKKTFQDRFAHKLSSKPVKGHFRPKEGVLVRSS